MGGKEFDFSGAKVNFGEKNAFVGPEVGVAQGMAPVDVEGFAQGAGDGKVGGEGLQAAAKGQGVVGGA